MSAQSNTPPLLSNAGGLFPRGVGYIIATPVGVFYGGCFKDVLGAANASLPVADRLERSNVFKVMRGARRYGVHKGCRAARVAEDELFTHPIWCAGATKTLVAGRRVSR